MCVCVCVHKGKERSMRPVDLTGRPLGICKVATRYRVNPCPTPSSFFPFTHFFLLSTSFPPRPGRGVDGNFCHENRHFSPQQAELRLPRGDGWQRWTGRWTTPPQEPGEKNVLFRDLVYQLESGSTLDFILDQDLNDSKHDVVCERRVEEYR